MPEPARVIAIHRFFWPDSPPYATFLRAIAGRWRRDGADVEVLAAQPSYIPGQETRAALESVDGFAVRRLPAVRHSQGVLLRVVDMIAFPALVAGRVLMGHRPDVVMCSTVPQVTLGVATALASRMRRARFIYHCMDLHPEIGRLSGEFANPLAYRLLLALDTWTMRRSWRVVVLSDDMRAAVIARDARLAAKVVVRNNFALAGGEAGESPLPDPEAGTLRIVFAGNVGRFQGLEQVVAGFLALTIPVAAELVFMGEGKAKAGLMDLVREQPPRPGLRVRFLDHGSVPSARALMASAHVGIVSLTPGVVRYAYPSKTATYADVGLPILVVCEGNSQLARDVDGNELGWWVAPGDAAAVTVALTEAAAELVDGRLDSRRHRVADYGDREFGQEQVLDWWSDLLREARGRTRGELAP